MANSSIISAFLCATAFLTPVLANAQSRDEPPALPTVAAVDLVRYSGLWFEVARLPNKFQRQCVSDVSAQYTLLMNGEVFVSNRCALADGKEEVVSGRARAAEGSNLEASSTGPSNTGPSNTGPSNTGPSNTGPSNTGPSNTGPSNTGASNTGANIAGTSVLAPARLQVTFVPTWMRWINRFWGEYNIIELAPDYSYAVIGTSDRKYLWVLARDPKLNPASLTKLLANAQALGFDVSQVSKTAHK
jgi:apolipoprotein D and lipocalin family protein